MSASVLAKFPILGLKLPLMPAATEMFAFETCETLGLLFATLIE